MKKWCMYRDVYSYAQYVVAFRKTEIYWSILDLYMWKLEVFFFFSFFIFEKIWNIQDQCCLFDAHPKASCLRGELSASLYFIGVKSLYVATDSLFLLSLKTK